MSNVLKVTSPLAGYENANAVRTGPVKTPDPAIQGQVNPDKVVKPDARSDSGAQGQDVGLKFQYESNYENFVQQMRELTPVTDGMTSLLFERAATLAESGLSDGFAQQIGELFTMVDVNPQEMLAFLRNQGNSAVRFSGAFFSLLRQVMKDTGSVELKGKILDFLRRYTDMAESPHMMQSAGHLIENLKHGMFQNAREQLEELSQGLDYHAKAGSPQMQRNVDILRDQVLPFLNRYISRTHDRSGFRDLAAQLASYVARGENGSTDRIMEVFEDLMKYQGMQKYFKGFDPRILLKALENTEFEKAARQEAWTTKLAEIIDAGAAGEAGSEHKAAFRNLMQAILLNESVYMPVLHMMLPMQMNGQLMFAEMWIDPDAEKENKNREREGRVVQGLVKFDIQDVGFFDLYFVYQNGSARLQINCPDTFDEKLDTVRQDIARILAENEIETEELFVESGQKSILVSEAFPKIFERKNSINVRI